MPTTKQAETMDVEPVDQRPNSVLQMWNRMSPFPGGALLFSRAVAFKAPYFKSIDAVIEELRPNFAKVKLKKRRSVQNHIGTVHAIAICNLLEMAMGVCAEASIPKGLRWIPKGIDLEYPGKAKTDVVGIAEINPEQWRPGDMHVKVTAYDTNDLVVVQGQIELWITETKSDKK